MYTACAVCARIAAPCVRLYGRFPGNTRGCCKIGKSYFKPLARCFDLGFRRVSVLTLALSMWACRRLCPSCHAYLSVRIPADFHRRERPHCAELLRDTRTAALCTDASALRKACRAVRQVRKQCPSFRAVRIGSRCGRSVSRPMLVFPSRQIMDSLHRLSFLLLARPHAGFASRSPCVSHRARLRIQKPPHAIAAFCRPVPLVQVSGQVRRFRRFCDPNCIPSIIARAPSRRRYGQVETVSRLVLGHLQGERKCTR